VPDRPNGRQPSSDTTTFSIEPIEPVEPIEDSARTKPPTATEIPPRMGLRFEPA
jgi:hypothetical protein